MSKWMWGLALSVTVFLSPAAGGGSPDYAKPLLEKAIKALGHGDKQKWQGSSFDSKAKITINQLIISFDGNWNVQGSDKFHVNLNLQINNNPVALILVLNGNQLWLNNSQNNKTDPLPPDAVANVQALVRVIRFAQQPGLLLDKAFKLSSLGELQIGKATAVGLRIEQPKQRDLSLYFDKASGLPLKAEVIIKEDQTGELLYSFHFSEYKEFKGVQQFTKVVLIRDQQEVMEMTLSNLQLQENIDVNVFAKP